MMQNIVYRMSLLFLLMCIITACKLDNHNLTNIPGANSSKQVMNAGAGKSNITKPEELMLKVALPEFIQKSGLKATTPQIWIFDAKGVLVSSEFGLISQLPLNIESGKIGPGEKTLNVLKDYLMRNSIDLKRWAACGSDYCVVRILPDSSLGSCSYCETSESLFDAFLTRTNSIAAYRTILLTN